MAERRKEQRGHNLAHDVDQILAEIDAVLDEQAENDDLKQASSHPQASKDSPHPKGGSLQRGGKG